MAEENKRRKDALPNQVLRKEREDRGWTQAYVAERIGLSDSHTIGRWERGVISPSPFWQKKLCDLYQKNEEELGFFAKRALYKKIPGQDNAASHATPLVPSLATLKKRYLSRKIFETQDLVIEGIPLVPPKVHLDAIFISLQLYPHQLDLDIDQWLTPEQKEQLREGIRNGKISTEVERVLISAEQRHEQRLRGNDKVAMHNLWQHLKRDHPAAVIQGYPGMGKSTLLLRLTLFMARRGLGEPDPLEEPVSPILVPLFLRLGQYATFLQQAKDENKTTIWDYLGAVSKELDELIAPAMFAWWCLCLEQGQCLVLFDGLDEVSDLQTRAQVQEAIRTFITDVSSKTFYAESFNRFLITSRVAGYDKNAFPGYPHYTISELSTEKVMEFLPRWCRANAQGNTYAIPPQEAEAWLLRQAEEMEQRFTNTLQSHQGVRELVLNPFLLTLLAVMQQNGIELPRRRVELYTLLTKVLLENRNAKRGLPEIPEVQAIQLLGPIAYQMQATKNSFASKQDVLDSLCATITDIEKVSAEQAHKDATAFLERIRVRGGIFVLRTGDYYGFFHRTFQEYFAARYMLRRLALTPDESTDLLQKARQHDDLWREPFLLALAYQINDVGSKTWEIVRALLAPTDDSKHHAHDVLLAGEALIEAKESMIPHDLEQNFVLVLLSIYEDAQLVKDSDTCGKCEVVMERLLLSISSETIHSVRLSTLQECMLDHLHPHRQRSALTMLTMTAQSLLPCEDIVFGKIVPALLGLTGLPAVGTFEPVLPTGNPDLALVDLALAALCYLGVQGPAGASLKQVRAHFEPYLPLLARYSLEKGFPITPAIVSFSDEGYKNAIERCRQVHETVEKQRQRVTAQDIATYISIQSDLLKYTEEVCYPAHMYLLEMLRLSQTQPDQSWEKIWQAYLREQMRSGTYLAYQICALLWVALFPEPKAQQTLASLLLNDLSASIQQQRYAQRFLLSAVHDLRYFVNMKHVSTFINLPKNAYFESLSELVDFKYLTYIKYFLSLRYFRGLSDLTDFRYFMDNFSHLTFFRYYRDLINIRSLNNFVDLINFRYFKDLIHFNSLIFTEQVIFEVRQRLYTCTKEECRELLILLAGRILQIQGAEEKSTKVEHEIKQIVQSALFFAHAGSDTQEVALDIFRYLPMRTEQEVAYGLDCVQNSQDDSLQESFLVAVKGSLPESDMAWAALEGALTSSSAKVREAVERRLKERC